MRAVLPTPARARPRLTLDDSECDLNDLPDEADLEEELGVSAPASAPEEPQASPPQTAEASAPDHPQPSAPIRACSREEFLERRNQRRRDLKEVYLLRARQVPFI